MGLKQIKVELLDHMGDDLRVANVARVSFNKWKEEIDNGDTKLIKYLADHEHSSPFRHTAITLRCEAPIWLARQLGKHQVGLSWNEVSRRYVSNDVALYMPQVYRKRPEGGIKQGSSGESKDSESWISRTKGIHKEALDLYEDMIRDGLAPEQARGILPQNMMTTWIWTGSLTSFYHLYRLRVDSHAQLEAQYFASQVGDIISQVFPISWEALKES